MTRMYNPPHPGRQLKEAIISIPMTVTQFATHIGVDRTTLSRVVNQKAGISAEMSIKISAAFGHTPDLWFKMQNAHDFWMASQKEHTKVKPVKVAA